MVYKLIGTLVILAAGVLAFLIVQDGNLSNNISIGKRTDNCVQLTPAQQLIKLINDDIDQLRKDRKLPKEWDAIATIEYKVRSELARTLLGSEKLSLQRVKEGNHYLEVEVLDMPDENDPGIILQMSLKEIKSKNKIFELGRTYLMSTLNKQTPPKEAAAPVQQSVAPTTPKTQPASPQPSTPQSTVTPTANSDKSPK